MVSRLARLAISSVWQMRLGWRSTVEVIGLDDDLGRAWAKSQMAARPALPKAGNCFLSVKDHDKPRAVDIARQLEPLAAGRPSRKVSA